MQRTMVETTLQAWLRSLTPSMDMQEKAGEGVTEKTFGLGLLTGVYSVDEERSIFQAAAKTGWGEELQAGRRVRGGWGGRTAPSLSSEAGPIESGISLPQPHQSLLSQACHAFSYPQAFTSAMSSASHAPLFLEDTCLLFKAQLQCHLLPGDFLNSFVKLPCMLPLFPSSSNSVFFLSMFLPRD